MNGKIVISFFLGAICGAIGTYFVVNRKPKMNEPYEEYTPSFFDKQSSNNEPKINNDIQISNICADYKVPEAIEPIELTEEGGDDMPNIEVVTSEEVENTYDYSIETLYYTVDGVVIDTANNRFPNANKILGTDFMNHYGEDPNEPDIVYVKNREQKTYYEICKDDDVYNEG